MKFSNFLKNLNKYEKIYAVVFLASIITGIINGLINLDYYKCCEESIGVPKGGTSVLKIFSGNFFLSLTELLTAGLTSIYFNFHTFSLTSSYLSSQGIIYMLPIILLIGFLELLGSVFMGLVGFTFIERKLFKLKSKLNYTTLFLFGVAFIFIGAVIEFLLLKPVL